MKLARVLALTLMLLDLLLPWAPIVKAAGTPTASMVITEIKLGDSAAATTDMPKEYVAIYNQSDQPVILDGWTLEYAKTTFDTTHCGSSNWVTYSKSGSASSTALSGTLLPGQVSAPIVRQLTDNTAGSLHLVDASKTVEDLVGWGTSAPCYQTAPAAIPPNAKSVQRNLDCVSAYPVNAGDNSKDFAVSTGSASPGFLAGASVNCPAPTTGSVGGGESPTCNGLVISEILPNPAGADAGHEFVELYNPTGESVSLAGCGLQVGGSPIYKFGDISLAPQEFRAFYDGQTGLTLPNSAGGTVYLLSPTQEELASVSYPANQDDDQSWSWFGQNSWQATYAVTPGDVNVLAADKPCPAGQDRNPSTGRCKIADSLIVYAPCPEGQSRNPETHRCREIVLGGSTLKPCGVGKERNPQTNRCRSIVDGGSSLAPCPAGKTRNPATNRCRGAATASSPKPCPPGKERNPDTHRCRNAAGTANGKLPKVQDIAGTSTASHVSWGLAGLALLAAGAYAVWEWRLDLLNLLQRLRKRSV